MSGGKLGPSGEEASVYRVGLLPTVAGAFVVNALVAGVAYLKMAAGADPVALRSQNLPRSEANEELIARYRKRRRLY